LVAMINKCYGFGVKDGLDATDLLRELPICCVLEFASLYRCD
jgi:hypothetical protein